MKKKRRVGLSPRRSESRGPRIERPKQRVKGVLDRPFDLGTIVATPGILDLVPRTYLTALLDLHRRGVWPRTPLTSLAENVHNAAKNSGRISGSYTFKKREIWVVTEGGRGDPPRRTTILLPEEN